jgi:hypothetical protein
MNFKIEGKKLWLASFAQNLLIKFLDNVAMQLFSWGFKICHFGSGSYRQVPLTDITRLLFGR